MIQRLEWCDQNREGLAEIAWQAGVPKKGIEWKDRAKKLVEAYGEFLAEGNREVSRKGAKDAKMAAG